MDKEMEKEELLSLVENQGYRLLLEEWKRQLAEMEEAVWGSANWDAFMTISGQRAGLMQAMLTLSSLIDNQEAPDLTY